GESSSQHSEKGFRVSELPWLLSELFARALPTDHMGLGTHTVEKFSACSHAVTSSGLELSRSIGPAILWVPSLGCHPITYLTPCCSCSGHKACSLLWPHDRLGTQEACRNTD
uniref:Uncharacterized protein n=1 Tax=Sus scrofa TaxID=9823 RepID=A0A8D1NF31_PIG